MPDLPKTMQDQEGSRSSSEMDGKRNSLIDELSDLLDKTGENHGPFLMNELLRRLELVVNNFNEELTLLIKGSFKKWKDKDTQLRILMADDMKVIKNKAIQEELISSKSPDFIKDVKFGPKRPK